MCPDLNSPSHNRGRTFEFVDRHKNYLSPGHGRHMDHKTAAGIAFVVHKAADGGGSSDHKAAMAAAYIGWAADRFAAEDNPAWVAAYAALGGTQLSAEEDNLRRRKWDARHCSLDAVVSSCSLDTMAGGAGRDHTEVGALSDDFEQQPHYPGRQRRPPSAARRTPRGRSRGFAWVSLCAQKSLTDWCSNWSMRYQRCIANNEV